MSLRERFKQSVKDLKGDAKALFQHKGDGPDKIATRPATTFNTLPHTTGPAVKRGLVGSAMDTVKFGPLKDLSDMLQGLTDMYIMDDATKKEYDALQQRLQKLLELLEEHSDEEISPTMESKVQGICDFIEAELNSMGIKQLTTQPRRLHMAKDQEERFVACCQRIQEYMDKLLDRMASLVGRLPFSSSACYNSSVGEELRRRVCTPGTRIDVLATLIGWARNNSNSGVYWLNGMAGTGKTTIAYSVCNDLDAGLNLAVSFFCSRLREGCRDVNMIIPSIAYQLARLFRPFQSALSAVLEEDPDIHTKRPDLQFRALIEQPLLSAKPRPPGALVVVIDALDECDNKESTRSILNLLITKATNLPIKFIVSSRPEPQIRDQMAEEQVNLRLILHELDTGNVQADIKKYLQDELKSMKPPPTDAQITSLVERAGILFIYAATAVRYIGYDNFHRNPSARLRTILDGPQGRKSSENQGIDELYTTILDGAFVDKGLEESDRADMQQVLHTVICAREPLTIDGLSKLLQMNDVDRVQAALRPLWSVVHVVRGSELVTTLHASFPDYMFDVSRSKMHHCDSSTHNRALAERCFERIQGTHPQFNILGLESSYLRDEDVPNIEERVARGIPMGLMYACRYWADHIKASDCASSVIEKLQDFLSIRLLLWVEVLNLNKQMSVGTGCMMLVVNWCKVTQVEQEFIELAHDAKRFVDTFASNPVSRSTPHIYVSMLVFWPKSSPIAKHYAKYNRGPVRPEGTALDRRQLAHLSTRAFEQFVDAMVVSPDGSYLALMLGNGIGADLVLIDSSSGRKLLNLLRRHTEIIKSVAFSSNGARVFAGCTLGNDATILGWDTRSGEAVLSPLQLHGHIGNIRCLTFSSNCTRIATGSEDFTIRLWDVESGQTIYTLRIQDSSWVMSAVFSPDGTQIIVESSDPDQFSDAWHICDTQIEDANLVPLTSVGYDQFPHRAAFSSDGSRIIGYISAQIYVWDSQSGEKMLGPIEGHTGDIYCIDCSPDSRFIVSGSSDQTVRVWDVQNGNVVLGPLEAYRGMIASVAFTPDGSRIISACSGGLVCTWDAQQQNLTPGSTSAPSHRISCVKFSSGGTRFVCGLEEGTILICSARTGEMRVGPMDTHTRWIKAVDFMNDRIVSGSIDGKMCVCDALSGDIVLGPLQLGLGAIWAIAYSPGGQMIATGLHDQLDVWNAQSGNRVLGPLTGLDGLVVSVQFSPDGHTIAGSWTRSPTIAAWDVSTGENLFRTLDGHTTLICSMSYSPNGALIASCSNDNTIIVWDTYTGVKRLGPLTGHFSGVSSVHFSPDSTRLVSGSVDKTIRIWDAQTGEIVFKLHGHEDHIKSVEYSPDGTRILSLSSDKSVRIHDAQTPAERISCVIFSFTVHSSHAGSRFAGVIGSGI